ncbi:MAG: sulfite exporter TauE/SafE family protein [Candidatus Nitrospinota bacterium M3_3B_026]
MDATQILAGFAVGALVGFTGMGGGAVMTPVLILALGVRPTIAVGTDLIYAAVTKSAGTAAHGLQGTVHWRTVFLLAAGSLPGAAAGSVMFHSLQAAYGGALEPFIAKSIGVLLMVTAAVMILSKKGRRKDDVNNATGGGAPGGGDVFILPAAGFMVGVLVTFTSVGSGTLVAATLFTVFPGLGAARIIGSDIAHAALLLSVASAGHGFMGNVNWELASNLVAGSVPGVLLGSRLAGAAPEKLIKATAGGAMFFAGYALV